MKIRNALFLALCAAHYTHAVAFTTEYSGTVFALQGGLSYLDSNHDSQAFLDSGGSTYTYMPSSPSGSAGTMGVFVGNEYAVLKANGFPMLLQVGFEYIHFASRTFSGDNSVGISPDLTAYNYAYDVDTQQLLGSVRLIFKTKKQYYPYIEGALGIALNQSSSYHFSTTQEGAINLTSTFDNRNSTKLSFALGFGIDRQINNQIKVGLGYRFSYMGNAPLGNGAISGGDDLSVLFKLNTENLYANQLIARVSYQF